MKHICVALLLLSLIFVCKAEKCGVGCEFNIDGTKLTIIGKNVTGTKPRSGDYCKRLSPWYSSKDTITEIEVIGLDILGPCAFRHLSHVTTANIDAVNISERAFQYCSSLSSLTFSDKLDSLGANIIDGCTSLKKLTLPKTIQHIDENTFFSCSLAEFHVKNYVQGHFVSVDGVLFAKNSFEKWLIRYPPYKKNMTYTIPSDVIGIEEYAFKDCNQLQILNIPDYVRDIAETSFLNSTSLTEIVAEDTDRSSFRSIDGVLFWKSLNDPGCLLKRYPPNKIDVDYAIPTITEGILDYAFEGCSHLKTIRIPEKLYDIGDHTLDGCVNLENILVDSDSHVFMQDIALVDQSVAFLKYPAQHDGEEYVIPNDIFGIIDDKAFEGSVKLKKITIQDNIKYINSEAFTGCSGLESITIPSSVLSIAEDAFEGCTGLRAINVKEGGKSKCKSDEGVLLCHNKLVKYPAKKTDKKYIVQEVKNITKHAFEGCNHLLSVVIPESVKTIESEAFMGCEKLSSVEYTGLSDPMDDKSSSVFENCPNLEKVCVPPEYTDDSFCGKPVFDCHK